MKVQAGVPIGSRKGRTYAGRVYRSWLAARAARWLAETGATEIHYRPTVRLGNEMHHPDFYVIQRDVSYYVEVKRVRPRRRARLRRPSKQRGDHNDIIDGNVGLDRLYYRNAAEREKLQRTMRRWAKYGPAPLDVWTFDRGVFIHVKTIEGGRDPQRERSNI